MIELETLTVYNEGILGLNLRIEGWDLEMIRLETVPEKTQKCFGGVKEKMANNKKRKAKGRRKRSNKCLALKKVKELSFASMFRIFERFLSCSASVDVLN
ncbi:hypothetical protein PRUPE_4G261600 [Prunus persica]|nr:hypothetical protein PRUPE_4G261600 [Prunus persica]